MTRYQPTQHKPGSPEKISVMARRAFFGPSVFHPEDEPQDNRDRVMEKVYRSFLEVICETVEY